MTLRPHPVTGAKDALLEPGPDGSWRLSGQFTDQGRTRTRHCRIRAPLALGMACTRGCPECPERRRRLGGLSTGRAK
jgi:hypothetical protein